jgi:hypothetical protein
MFRSDCCNKLTYLKSVLSSGYCMSSGQYLTWNVNLSLQHNSYNNLTFSGSLLTWSVSKTVLWVQNFLRKISSLVAPNVHVILFSDATSNNRVLNGINNNVTFMTPPCNRERYRLFVISFNCVMVLKLV